jgi:hypothetical protein
MGSALLITSCDRHALCIFRQPLSRLDAEAREEHAPAEEVVSVPRLELDSNAVVFTSLADGRDVTKAETLRREIGAYKVVQAEITSTGVIML